MSGLGPAPPTYTSDLRIGPGPSAACPGCGSALQSFIRRRKKRPEAFKRHSGNTGNILPLTRRYRVSSLGNVSRLVSRGGMADLESGGERRAEGSSEERRAVKRDDSVRDELKYTNLYGPPPLPGCRCRLPPFHARGCEINKPPWNAVRSHGGVGPRQGVEGITETWWRTRPDRDRGVASHEGESALLHEKSLP